MDSSDDTPSCMAWRSLVRRSLEAWDAHASDPLPALGKIGNPGTFLHQYKNLDGFLKHSGQLGSMMFWFFQRREAFLSQKTMTKWSRDRLDDCILLPASHGFVTRTECFFVSHYWDSHNDPDPGGKYLKRVQLELGLQSWSYVWVDWTCLPQYPRSDIEEKYFLRALETMPAIIRNCGFMWHYPPFEPRLWILYEWAEYTLTCRGEFQVTEDNKDFLDHIDEMREVGVRATLNKYGYKCTMERDKEFITAWLELLVLLDKLLDYVGNIRHILDNLTWFPVTGNMLINTLNGLVQLHPFEGTLTLGEDKYRFTPFPQRVSFLPSLPMFILLSKTQQEDGKYSKDTMSAPKETQQPPRIDDSKEDIDQGGQHERIVRYRYKDGVLCME